MATCLVDPSAFSQQTFTHSAVNRTEAHHLRRSIIVRFRSKHGRFRVISNRKQLKDYNVTNDSKIFINEDLTAMRAKLFSTVRTLHKKRHFQQVWTYNGTIRVKDLQGLVKVIHNNEDIQNCLPIVILQLPWEIKAPWFVYHLCLIW